MRCVAGGLLALLVWQSWGLTHMRATPVAMLSVSDSAWQTPPPAIPAVRLDRLVLPVPVPDVARAAPLAAGPTAPRLTLQGIVVGNSPHAYVVDDTTQRTLTVRPGDHVGPVTITAIHDRTVVVEQEGDTYELRL